MNLSDDLIKNRIINLNNELKKHSYLYHTLDAPEISDEVYDSLYQELLTLEKKYPKFSLNDSVTKKAGDQVKKEFKKIKHQYRQYGYDNVFNQQELEEWEKRLKKLTTYNFSYWSELKLDGVKIILHYKNGFLVRGLTRGDGEYGEDITDNIKTIKSIPDTIFEKRDLIVIGEAVILYDDFIKLNKLQEKNKLPLFANPRNLVAGSLRQLNPKITEQRMLSVFFYDLIFETGEQIKTMEEVHQTLNNNNFPREKNSLACKNLANVFLYYQKMSGKRNTLPFALDGVVIKIQERFLYQDLGETSKSPRYGIAYKFPAEEKTTILEKIELQVGRTGAITPVAILKPITLGGTQVKRASLHNFEEIAKLDIRIGDTVIIKKAGEIIPKIISVVKNLRPKNSLPVDLEKLLAENNLQAKKENTNNKDGVIWYVTKGGKDELLLESLKHFVSKSAFDIAGLSEKTLAKLIDLGAVKIPADIFKITENDIKKLPNFKEKATFNLMQSIQKSKTISLERFIVALGIRHIGEETAKLLASYFKTWDGLYQATQDDIKNIHGIGEIMVWSWFDWKSNKEKQVATLDLLQHITFKNNEKNIKSNILENKSFVITGILPNISRIQAQEMIEENGGVVLDAVSKKVNYLIAGENPGSKIKKAVDFGVQIIDWLGFLSLIQK